MEKQPAYKSYFFDKGYKDVGNIMKKTWKNAFRPVTNELGRIKTVFAKNVFAGIFTVLCDLVVFSVITLAILTGVSIFSLFFLAGVAVGGVFVYVFYSLLAVLDWLFCLFIKISNHCPYCQIKFMLPKYKCSNPRCGAIHTALRPSVYGILKRKCQCGTKLPTTFLNGRQKLQAICPACGKDIKDGGRHIEITIPVVGGPSAGKTCFINMALSELAKEAPKHGLVYSYSKILDDRYEINKKTLEQGKTPPKTSDMRLRYYQFYLTPYKKKIKNLISLCDIAGEAYEHTNDIGGQLGYKNADAFMMLIDPLSIKDLKKELSAKINLGKYKPSDQGMDEVLDYLVTTLENVHCIDAKRLLKTDIVVVFTKGDIPTLEDKIGATAVKKYMKEKNISSRYEAQNKVCEKFLKAYGESNFLNHLKSKFKGVQFFCCSALGHVENSIEFRPNGVAEPVLWVVDKASKSIDLKDKWGKRL